MNMNKTIIGFAGEIGCGKDTAVNYFKDKYGAVPIKFSALLRDVLNRLYLDVSRENLQKLSTILRDNFGQDLFSKVVAKDVENSKEKIIVIDGVRRQTDLENLKILPGFKLVYIKTDGKIRFDRIVKRGENAGDQTKTFEQFKLENQAEAENQIRELKTHANVVIDNNRALEDLYEQLDKLIK